MGVLRVYVDTSVLGGCFDPEFAPWSMGLVDDFRAGRYVPVLSDLTVGSMLSWGTRRSQFIRLGR